MKVRVVKARDQNCWYSECVGDIFYVFMVQNANALFFSPSMFFYPEDVEAVTQGDGYVCGMMKIGIV